MDRRLADTEGGPIRVVLAEMPSMVAGIVRGALLEAGIDVVGEFSDEREPASALDRWAADVVIVPTESSGVAQAYHDLLRARPRVKILALTTTAQRADLYELRLLGGNVGLQGVVAAVRSVIGNPGDSDLIVRHEPA